MISKDQLREAESNGHSLFGASGWKKKLLCPGSLLAEIGKTDDTSFEAAEGTVAHHVAEDIFSRGDLRRYASNLVNTPKVKLHGHEIEITASMVEYVSQYTDWCLELPGNHFVEQLVDLSRWTPIPNQKGSVDHAALTIGHATITDLKFGTGVQVFAKRNPQATGYALGLIEEWDWLYDFKTVTIRICQPRLGHFDVWETTVAELREYGEEIKLGLAKTWVPDAPRSPSEEACRFCRARKDCGAIIALAERLADDTFDNLEANEADQIAAVDRMMVSGLSIGAEPWSMTTTHIERALSFRKLFERFFKDAHAELQRRVLTGEQVENWFMMEGKISRSVKSTRKVIRLMSQYGIEAQDLFDVDFKSPAQLEDMLVKEAHLRKKDAKHILAPFINEQPGKPTLAEKKPGKIAAIDLSDDSFDDLTDRTTSDL